MARKTFAALMAEMRELYPDRDPADIHGDLEALAPVWRAICRRCNCPADKDYPRYGGRGITVADEWRGPEGRDNFRRWALSAGYRRESKMTVDRRDNDGPYGPGNCRLRRGCCPWCGRPATHLVVGHDGGIVGCPACMRSEDIYAAVVAGVLDAEGGDGK